jgi:alpha-beta hydrolase superfamily lysophospholipase
MLLSRPQSGVNLQGVERNMLKKLGLAAILLVAGAVPALADDTCQAPPIPAAVDGSTASRDQVLAAQAAVKAYIASSDTYQACINDYVTAQKTQADKDKKPMDAAIIQTEGDKITANQNTKQKVGDDFNTAVGAYKKAHPG